MRDLQTYMRIKLSLLCYLSALGACYHYCMDMSH